jgi:multicomponent Na+:H+ antiporter subunit F
MRLIRWLIGLILILSIFTMIIYYPITLLRRCLFVLLLCGIFCVFRVMWGPTSADRIVAIDILGILIVGFCAILGVATGRFWYVDIGIAWALQSFIGTLALAKYLEGRSFDD